MNEQENKKGSEYVVFKQAEGGWEDLPGRYEGNANGAMRQAAEGNGPGRYFAVPARSFKPITVTVEQKIVVTKTGQ
jgi:hypothetical protein